MLLLWCASVHTSIMAKLDKRLVNRYWSYHRKICMVKASWCYRWHVADVELHGSSVVEVVCQEKRIGVWYVCICVSKTAAVYREEQ